MASADKESAVANFIVAQYRHALAYGPESEIWTETLKMLRANMPLLLKVKTTLAVGSKEYKQFESAIDTGKDVAMSHEEPPQMNLEWAFKWIAEKLAQPESRALSDAEVALLALSLMKLSPTPQYLGTLSEYVRARRRKTVDERSGE